MRKFAALALAGWVVACGGQTDQQENNAAQPAAAPPAAAEGSAVAQTYAPQLDVNLAAMTHTASGLYVEDVKAGTGAVAEAGKTVVVHYTGWLPDGTKFDSSLDRNQPYSFQLGAGRVIKGWDEGVAGMKVGGERKLVIPPDLAYGPGGRAPVIPPNATLVFDVQLVDVK